MRKLHLHIGSAKTGTTSIQNTFFQNRSQLDKQGYIYPGDEVKHHKLFFVTKSPEEDWPAVYNKANKKVLKKEVETYLQKFEQDLKTFDREYIISSEYFFISNEKYVRNIIQGSYEANESKWVVSESFKQYMI